MTRSNIWQTVLVVPGRISWKMPFELSSLMYLWRVCDFPCTEYRIPLVSTDIVSSEKTVSSSHNKISIQFFRSDSELPNHEAEEPTSAPTYHSINIPPALKTPFTHEQNHHYPHTHTPHPATHTNSPSPLPSVSPTILG